MKKDVIYIDIEDDITSIIDKVHKATNKIVALVPPKRTGVLQSAVNLKLLQKAADTESKRIVLITSDSALSALAAGVRMPIAKNLQSKPEMASMPSPDTDIDDEDVINGEELPIGELARTSASPAAAATVGLGAAARQASDEMGTDQPKKFSALAAAGTLKKNGMKIPNFESFRKRLFLIIGIGLIMIGFLVWAIIFAPRATVTVTAKTSAIDIQKDLILDPSAEPDAALGRLRPNVQQIKKTATTEFETTGSKEIGEKASGSVSVTNCDTTSSFTIPAGSAFTASSGKVYTNAAAVTVPGYSGSSSLCRNTGTGAGTASVTVTANEYGPEYNSGSTRFSIENVEGDIYASSQSLAGGTRETVKVVSAQDVEKAKQQVGAQDSTAARKELEQQFKGDYVLIKESFVAVAGQPRPEPAVGEQAQRGRLTVETTYTLVGLERNQLKSVLNEVLNGSIKDGSQLRIYSSGDQNITFSQFESSESSVSSVRLSTTGQIGPSINAKSLARQLVGKRYGEIEQIVNRIDGVEKVDINFSPFWVGKAPSEDKITVRFNVKTNAN